MIGQIHRENPLVNGWIDEDHCWAALDINTSVLCKNVKWARTWGYDREL